MIYLIKLQCIRLFCNAMSSFIRLFCNEIYMIFFVEKNVFSYNPIISEAYDIFVYHHRVALCLIFANFTLIMLIAVMFIKN